MDLATPVHNCHIDQFFIKPRSDPIFSGFAPRVTAIRLTESAINTPSEGIFKGLLASPCPWLPWLTLIHE